jgi:hypothetical protein
MEYLVIGRPLEGIKSKSIMERVIDGLEYRKKLKNSGKIVYFGNYMNYCTATPDRAHRKGAQGLEGEEARWK